MYLTLLLQVLKAQPRRGGAADASSRSATQFEWPPRAFLARRRRRLSLADGELPTGLLLRLAFAFPSLSLLLQHLAYS